MKLNKQTIFRLFGCDSLENKSLIENDVDTKPKGDHIATFSVIKIFISTL